MKPMLQAPPACGWGLAFSVRQTWGILILVSTIREGRHVSSLTACIGRPNHPSLWCRDAATHLDLPGTSVSAPTVVWTWRLRQVLEGINVLTVDDNLEMEVLAGGEETSSRRSWFTS